MTKAWRFIFLLVFWPWIVIGLEGLVYWWATARGCIISAEGPQPCFVWGYDFGNQISGLWTLGYQVVYSLLWVVPMLALAAIIGVIQAIRADNSD